MEESILTSIKKLLGINANYTNFDTDIIIHINSVFMTLHQLGIGPKEGFRIENGQNLWSEYIQPTNNLDAIKTYMYLKVKLIFDPPLSSAVMESVKQTINELEWRLNIQAES